MKWVQDSRYFIKMKRFSRKSFAMKIFKITPNFLSPNHCYIKNATLIKCYFWVCVWRLHITFLMTKILTWREKVFEKSNPTQKKWGGWITLSITNIFGCWHKTKEKNVDQNLVTVSATCTVRFCGVHWRGK